MNPTEDKALQEALLNHPAIKQTEWKLIAICAIIVAVMGWGFAGYLTYLAR